MTEKVTVARRRARLVARHHLAAPAGSVTAAAEASGEVVFRLLEDAGSDAATAVEAEAARLETWLGPLRVTPRFRTPLERELSAG